MVDLSRPDLRALFRTNDRALAPVDVFANRAEEWDAVRRSLAGVVALRRDPGFDVEDVQRARRNVLAFYGVGGIGKSTLSRRIAERLAHPEAGPEHWPPVDDGLGRVLPIRIDLSRQTGAGFESVMLAVRLALAEGLVDCIEKLDASIWFWWGKFCARVCARPPSSKPPARKVYTHGTRLA